MRRTDHDRIGRLNYERACDRLAALGRAMGMRAPHMAGHGPDDLAASIDLAGLRLPPGTVRLASKAAATAVSVALVPMVVALAFYGKPTLFIVGAFASTCTAILSGQAIMSYPASRARKQGAAVLRSSPEATNLMIMSLRHDSSVSKAIAFASRRK